MTKLSLEVMKDVLEATLRFYGAVLLEEVAKVECHQQGEALEPFKKMDKERGLPPKGHRR